MPPLSGRGSRGPALLGAAVAIVLAGLAAMLDLLATDLLLMPLDGVAGLAVQVDLDQLVAASTVAWMAALLAWRLPGRLGGERAWRLRLCGARLTATADRGHRQRALRSGSVLALRI